MSDITLGIIGGGQLGSMLAIASKKVNIKTVVFCDDVNAPAQNFCNHFIYGNYDDNEKVNEFVNLVDIVTFEFENIPYETLNQINTLKTDVSTLKTKNAELTSIIDKLKTANSFEEFKNSL